MLFTRPLTVATYNCAITVLCEGLVVIEKQYMHFNSSFQAFFQGKLKITGNMGLAMKLKEIQPKKANL